MQGLGGKASALSAAAGMSGNRPTAASADPFPVKVAASNAGSWVCDRSGMYLIAFQGAGRPWYYGDEEEEADPRGGGGGAIAIKRKRIVAGDTISWTGNVVTFPDGVTIGQTLPGEGWQGAVAFGGDVNVGGGNGTGINNSGGQAASHPPFFGGSKGTGWIGASGEYNVPAGPAFTTIARISD